MAVCLPLWITICFYCCCYCRDLILEFVDNCWRYWSDGTCDACMTLSKQLLILRVSRHGFDILIQRNY